MPAKMRYYATIVTFSVTTPSKKIIPHGCLLCIADSCQKVRVCSTLAGKSSVARKLIMSIAYYVQCKGHTKCEA